MDYASDAFYSRDVFCTILQHCDMRMTIICCRLSKTHYLFCNGRVWTSRLRRIAPLPCQLELLLKYRPKITMAVFYKWITTTEKINASSTIFSGDLAKIIYHFRRTVDDAYDRKIFLLLCMKNYIDIAEWMIDNGLYTGKLESRATHYWRSIYDYLLMGCIYNKNLINWAGKYYSNEVIISSSTVEFVMTSSVPRHPVLVKFLFNYLTLIKDRAPWVAEKLQKLTIQASEHAIDINS